MVKGTREPGKFCIVKFSKQKQIELYRFTRKRYVAYDVKELLDIVNKKRSGFCFICPKDHQCKYEVTSITGFFNHVKELEKKLAKQLIYFAGERKVRLRGPRKSLNESFSSSNSNKSNDLVKKNLNANKLNSLDKKENISKLTNEITIKLKAISPDKIKNEPFTEIRAKSSPKIKTESSVKLKAKSSVKSNAKSSAKSNAKSSVKSNAKSSVKSNAKSSVKSNAKSSKLIKQTKPLNLSIDKKSKSISKLNKSKNSKMNGGSGKSYKVAKNLPLKKVINENSSNNSNKLINTNYDTMTTPKSKSTRNNIFTSTPIPIITPVINLFSRLIPFSSSK